MPSYAPAIGQSAVPRSAPFSAAPHLAHFLSDAIVDGFPHAQRSSVQWGRRCFAGCYTERSMHGKGTIAMARTIDGTATTEKQAPAPNRDGSHGHERLTLKAAADLLNVQHGYLVELLDAGKIPATGVGARRHIRRDDVLGYKQERDAIRREGLRELTRMGEAAGLDDADYRVLLSDPS